MDPNKNNQELPQDEPLCPDCGTETAPEEEIPAVMPPLNEEEPEPVDHQEEIPQVEIPQPKKRSTGKLVLTIVGIVLLAAILVCAVLYASGVDFKPRPNDIFNKETYTQTDAKAAKNADKVVAALGDYELTNGELQIYYQMNLVNFLNQYGYMAGIDPMKPLDLQVKDAATGETWQQYFIETSIRTWQRNTVLRMLSKESHFELDKDTQAFLDSLEAKLMAAATQSGFTTVDELVVDEMGANADFENYKSYMTTYYEGLGYFDSVYESLLPSEEDAEAYFDANADKYKEQNILKDGSALVDVRHILLSPEGGTPDDKGQMTYTDEAWEACEKKAQNLLEEWKSGKATEESFAELASKHTMDPGSKQNGGLYQGVRKGDMVPEFDAWLFESGRKPGDSGLVKTMFGYHLMYYVDSTPIWLMTAQSDLMNERTDKMLEDGIAKWPMEVTYKKISLSDPLAKRAQEQATAPSVPELTQAPVESTAEPSEATK